MVFLAVSDQSEGEYEKSYIFIFIVDPGRYGYPGAKGQRGEHGANGPNVYDKNHTFLNFLLCIYCRLMVADVLDHFLDHQGILYVLHIYSYHGILLSFFFSRD